MGVGFGILKTSGSGGGGGGTTITTVANYSALPSATAVSGKFYWCEASQGTKWLPFSVGGTYYPLGMYYSNGVTWEYSETPYQATLSEVNTGTNTDKFVSPYTFTSADKWNNYTPNTRTISTTSPLAGGGDLSANRTFTISQANTTTDGYLSSTDWNTFNSKGNGTVTSVGLTMPTAFTVSNSPITGSGAIAVTGAGLSSQYIRGDGQLATFPTSTGGGSSVYYYLNGSINASVIGYKQLDNTAIIGAGTDFNLTGNGLIAQFLTNVANPNRNLIPSGAWNFEMFFSMSSSGGNTKFYVELLKYNGTIFTSISSTIAVPEQITGGTTIDLYLTSLAVPETVLLTTDRLAVRVYVVDNSGGRTVTLHTEDNHLCQIITTFAGGISSLNGLNANTQYFATGTSGTDFNISSVTDTHTFNLPTASATNRGALSSTDWSIFNGKANLASPSFTGAPLVPTPILSDNSSKIANTSWVSAKTYSRFLAFYDASTNAFYGVDGAIIVLPTLVLGDYFIVSVAGIGNISYGGTYYDRGDTWSYRYDGSSDIFVLLNSIQTSTIGDYSSTTGTITTTDTIVSAISKLNGNIAAVSPPFIPSLIGNETYRGISINNNSTTVISDGGVVMSSSASTLAQAVSSTNFATKQIRLRYYASTVSGGRYTGTRGSALLWYIHGGFKFVCDFNISDTSYSAGCQQFYGLAGQITDLAYGTATGILVSTLINIVGVGSENGDANLSVFHNDATGTATKVDLGVGFPANRTVGAISTTVYSIKLYNECMSTDVKYEVKNNETGSIANGTISTNLPLTSQGLNFFASRCMSVTSVTSTGQFDLSKLGVYSQL
jgi:hypothetical protein